MQDMVALIKSDLQVIVQQYGNKNLHLALAAVFIAMFLFLTGCVFLKNFPQKADTGNKGVGKRMKQVMFWFFVFFLFVTYVCYLLELTLLTREAGSRIDVSLRLFGTWHPDLYSQCFMVENLLLFLPFGCLFTALFPFARKFWRILLCSFLLSLAIEYTQLRTGRGFFQVDDLWLNTLGGGLGSIPCLIVDKVYKMRKLKKNLLE